MGQQTRYATEERMECIFQVSMRLENYKYPKPIDVTKKIKGYEDFKALSVSIDIEDASKSYYQSCKNWNLSLHGLLKDLSIRNTNF